MSYYPHVRLLQASPTANKDSVILVVETDAEDELSCRVVSSLSTTDDSVPRVQVDGAKCKC